MYGMRLIRGDPLPHSATISLQLTVSSNLLPFVSALSCKNYVGMFERDTSQQNVEHTCLRVALGDSHLLPDRLHSLRFNRGYCALSVPRPLKRAMRTCRHWRWARGMREKGVSVLYTLARLSATSSSLIQYLIREWWRALRRLRQQRALLSQDTKRTVGSIEGRHEFVGAHVRVRNHIVHIRAIDSEDGGWGSVVHS